MKNYLLMTQHGFVAIVWLIFDPYELKLLQVPIINDIALDILCTKYFNYTRNLVLTAV